ncbi:MAG: hypothetical protein WCE21_02475 [Candidatus Babeliales bacterium]
MSLKKLSFFIFVNIVTSTCDMAIHAMENGHEDMNLKQAEVAKAIREIIQNSVPTNDRTLLQLKQLIDSMEDISYVDTFIGSTKRSDGTVIRANCLALAMKNNFPLDTVQHIWGKYECVYPQLTSTECFSSTTPDETEITYFVPVHYAATVQRLDVLSWLLQINPSLIYVINQSNATQDDSSGAAYEQMHPLAIEWSLESYKAMVASHLESLSSTNEKRLFFNEAIALLINSSTTDLDLFAKKLEFLDQNNPVAPHVAFSSGETLHNILEKNNFVKSLIFTNNLTRAQAYDNQIPQKQMHFLKNYLWQAYTHDRLGTILNDTNLDGQTARDMIKEYQFNWMEYGAVPNSTALNKLITLLDAANMAQTVETLEQDLTSKADLFSRINFAPLAGTLWKQEANKLKRLQAMAAADKNKSLQASTSVQTVQSSDVMNIASEISSLLGKRKRTEDNNE